MKPVIEPVEESDLRLRPLDERDLPFTLEWRNQDEVRQWFRSSDVIRPEQHRAWYDVYRRKHDDLVFIIEETRRWRRPIGQLSLYHIDRAGRSAEFGRLMIGDRAARGAGLGLRATKLALAVAFDTLGLARVYLEVLASNVRAIRIYEAIGFQEIARRGDIVAMEIRANAPSLASGS